MIERWIAQSMIRWKAAHTTREHAASTMERERVAILGLLQGLDPAALSQPVRIKRLPGLEDSSRDWSLLMVVDHLRIVNRDIAEVITHLASGFQPPREASIAGVKPSPEVTAAVISEFERGCAEFRSIMESVPDLKTALRFRHPWFGPMDAATWHFMAGFHMRLHVKQMELIRVGLSGSTRALHIGRAHM
jgi:hypothetical protein